ncbi:MAG: MerR family transcriptional regulator [Prevotella sp.]|nr:MerR family transcriptional regulator [Prevotella sp.]
MALNLKRNFKTYYSIREVAEMFELNESTLRYWEQEFSFLRPKTSGTAKIRQYQEKDIEQIRLIHNLVKVRGFKISAARDILQKNRKGAETTAKALSELIEMRTELEKLRDHLEML